MTAPLLQLVSDSADLNDYIQQGSYICWTNIKARALKNLPFQLTGTAQDKNVAFYLQAHKTTGAAVTQQLYAYNNASQVWRRRRAEDTHNWTQWVVYRSSLPTQLHVGPTRPIKTIAQLNTYLNNTGTTGKCYIIFDAGTYEGTLTIYGLGRFEIRGSQYGTQDRDAVVLENLIINHANSVQLYNVTISGSLQLNYNMHVKLHYVDIITPSAISLNYNIYTYSTFCHFQRTTNGDCIVAQGSAFMSFTDCYFKGSGTNALIALTNSHVDIYGQTTFSDANHCIFITFDSTVYSRSTAITINNINISQLYASTGSNVLMCPTSATTRTGTQAATISSPAVNTVGNNNSYIAYNTAYHT